MPKHSLSPPHNRTKRQAPNSPHPQQHQNDQYSLVSSQTWYAIGQCATTLELPQIAVRAFDTALRHVPDHVESLAALAKALRDEHPQQAQDLILSAFSQFPHLNNEPLLWKELAETHLALNQYEQAHQAITRALPLRPNDPELLLVAALALEHLNTQHAQHTYHTVLSIITSHRPGPTESEIAKQCHYKLGLMACSELNWKAATGEFQAAISFALQCKAKSDSELLWCLLASVRERAGDIDAALQACRDAMQVSGITQRKINIMAAYLALIPTKRHNIDPNYAIALLNPMVMVETNDDLDCLAWYLLGRAHSLMDTPREAYDALQCALRKGPSSPLPWLAVGSLYLRMGQLPDALAAYSQAARLLVDDGSIASATASAAAWDGLACVYERCDDQAMDAADACLRAAGCYRAAGDVRAASQAEQRAHSLQAAARGEAPIPSLKALPDAPLALLRNIVMNVIEGNTISSTGATSTTVTSADTNGNSGTHPNTPKIEEQPESKQQYHHLPSSRGSIIGRSHTPTTESNTPSWPRPVSLHLNQQQSPIPPPNMAQGPPPPPPQVYQQQHTPHQQMRNPGQMPLHAHLQAPQIPMQGPISGQPVSFYPQAPPVWR